MNWRRVWTIYRKELLDVLRDKMTLIMMIGLPIVAIPALQLFMIQSVIIQEQERDQIKARVAFRGAGSDVAKEWLKSLERSEFVTSPFTDSDVIDGKVDAIVYTKDDVAKSFAAMKSTTVELLYDRTTFRSRAAANRIDEHLDDVRSKELKRRLGKSNMSADFVRPLRVKFKNIASPSRNTGDILGRIVPIVLIVVLTIGAFYPTIDLVSGEKERGTFETLLSTPVTKFEILLGKYFTACTVSMTAGLANLCSLTASTMFTLSYISQHSSRFPTPSFDFSFWLVLVTLAVMIPLVLFVTALLMSVAAFARNVWQAQNYLTPLLCFIILPCVLAAWPSAKLSGPSHLLPVYNVALLCRDLMKGTATASSAIAVIVAAFVWAGAALSLAYWIFQSEEVVLSDAPDIILPQFSNEGEKYDALPPSVSIALLGGVFLLLFYFGSYFQGLHLKWGLIATEWLLLFVPVIAVIYVSRVDFRKALSLHIPRWQHLMAALLITPGALVLAGHLSAWQNKYMPMPENMMKGLAKLFETDGTVAGFCLAFFAVAISPAICEELLFRGAILSALRKRRLHRIGIIIIVGVLFGAFHLSVHRFLSVTVLGFSMTYLALRSRSILTSIFSHAFNNGSCFLIAGGFLPWLGEAESLEVLAKDGFPYWALALAILAVGVGVYIMEKVEPVEPE